jgi:hypothetical protein
MPPKNANPPVKKEEPSKEPKPTQPAPGSKKEVVEPSKTREEMEEKKPPVDTTFVEEEVPDANIREYILKHYGINANEEKEKKEKRVIDRSIGGKVQNVRAKHWVAGGLPISHL